MQSRRNEASRVLLDGRASKSEVDLFLVTGWLIILLRFMTIAGKHVRGRHSALSEHSEA